MSLRKRPFGQPKTGQQQPPPPQSRPPQKQGRKLNRDGTKSRVDDRIKRRMSMRYADISEPTSISVPDVPSLPVGARSIQSSRDRDASSREIQDFQPDPRVVDVKAMEQDNFDPDAYLKVKLANSTEAELKALQSSLNAAKAATATDLQKNVFNNYEQFVAISKEISTLENDLLELKESLSEWKSMPSLLQVDDATADRRRITRSSVADLRTLYATQLQTLHNTIEGSAKFVPATPGRHIISEMDKAAALNPATYKLEHTVHFVLLDDALLVAKRRRKRTGGPGRLVAERCWMLNDIVMQDVKDSTDVFNVIKIRYGKEVHVYRTERNTDKKTLLSVFRQASEELAARKRKEREGEHERRRSVWADGNRNSAVFPDPEAMPSLPDWMSEIAAREGLDGAKEKAERDALWVSDFADELSVAIALRQWDDAVALVESGEKRLSTTPLLGPKLTPLTRSLTSALLNTLADPMQRKSAVVHLTSLLQRLQAGPAARSAFLAMRAELMRKRVRALRFEGSVELYISDLAIVVFTGIKHTADWFLASFKENDTASCLVQWAKEQIESYAEMFKKQVHGSDVAPQTVHDCLEITRLQSKKLLKDNSLDFSHLLEQLLALPDPAPSPPLFPRQSASSRPITPAVVPEALPSPTAEAARPARPPRNLPPRSRDRPSSSQGRERVPSTPRREGMI